MPIPSLTQFSSLIAKESLRVNRFDVNFTNIPNFIGLSDRNLHLKCDALDIPGIQILTTNYKLFGGAHTFKIANSKNFDEIRLQFIATAYPVEYAIFEKWIQTINNKDNNTIQYHDDISRDFEITIYTETKRNLKDAAASSVDFFDSGENVSKTPTNSFVTDVPIEISFKVKVFNAIPIRLDPISLSWGTEDIIRFNVQFSYEKLEFTYSKIESVVTFPNLE
jgi:hypothetical protein